MTFFLQTKQELLNQILETQNQILLLEESMRAQQYSTIVIIIFICFSTFLIGYWTKKIELLLKNIKKEDQP